MPTDVIHDDYGGSIFVKPDQRKLHIRLFMFGYYFFPVFKDELTNDEKFHNPYFRKIQLSGFSCHDSSIYDYSHEHLIYNNLSGW